MLSLKITILASFIWKIDKNLRNWWFWLQKSSKFEENLIIDIYSLVPQIDHPVALCGGAACALEPKPESCLTLLDKTIAGL